MKIKLQDKYKLYINGQWRDASDGATIKTYNPATGELLTEIANASNDDVDAAVDAAKEAFVTWSKTTVAERAAILNKIADIIDENAEYLATIESMDNGKPIRETMGADIPLMAVRKQIASAIDIIVHLGRLRDKSRRVLEIAEVLNCIDGEIEVNKLYVFKEMGEEEDGRVLGSLQKTNNELINLSKLSKAGIV